MGYIIGRPCESSRERVVVGAETADAGRLSEGPLAWDFRSTRLVRWWPSKACSLSSRSWGGVGPLRHCFQDRRFEINAGVTAWVGARLTPKCLGALVFATNGGLARFMLRTSGEPYPER
jgi:hypothetical protein